MENAVTQVNTFGDARRLILETIIGIRDETITISQGMAIAANMKVLNDNIQCEINAAKLSIVAAEKAKDFGRIVPMGRRIICQEEG